MQIRGKSDNLVVSKGSRLLASKSSEVKSSEPKDTFTPQSPVEEEKSSGSWIIKILDTRVPTTRTEISDITKEKILSSVQPGDIILETNNAYPSWQILEKVALNTNYTHAAMYEGDGKLIEATSDGGVKRSDLKEYLECLSLFEIIRPPYKTPQDREAALNYCRSQLGKKYDARLNLSDDKEHYCAELVYKALTSIPNKIEVPLKKFLGKPVVSPSSFKEIKGAQVIYSDNSNFWENIATHWPVSLGATTAAVAGGMVMGPLGVVIGFLGGLAISIHIGNKIQTGD